MPHVVVKLWPGQSEQHKRQLAEKVYTPDILNNPEKLYKKPGYTM